MPEQIPAVLTGLPAKQGMGLVLLAALLALFAAGWWMRGGRE